MKNPLLIPVDDYLIQDLLSCRRNSRNHLSDFSQWTIQQLLRRAVEEFKDKYGEEK